MQFDTIFALWLVKWRWWNNSLNNIYVSPFLFFILLVRLNWQVYCRDSFQLPNFPINSVFVILFHFQERKKAQQSSRLSRCYRGSPSLNPLHRVYWIINVFSQYCLAHASKQSFIWELFHLLSKAFYFFTYEIIHITESTAKLCRFEKYWIKHYGNRLGVFFIL